MNQPDIAGRAICHGTMSMISAELMQPPIIVINGNDGMLVSIHPDGHLEYGEHYQPDEAAARFWDALSTAWGAPRRCPNCNAQLGI